MLIKEYLNIVGKLLSENKERFKIEFLLLVKSLKIYIKNFNLKNYLKKNIFEGNIFLNIFLLFFKMIYDFFMFFLYTLDLFVTYFFKWFFYILYMSLDLWETYIFEKIYEFKKNVVKSKKYKRENALLAKKRAEFFNKFLISFEKDLKICLEFDKRNYSIIYKYYKYFSIWISSFFKWFIFFIRKNKPLLQKQINSWIKNILIGDFYINWFLFFQIKFLKYIRNFIIIILKLHFYFISKFKIFFHFILIKLGMIYEAYQVRKKFRKKFYIFLYINYFFFYKKKTRIQKEFSVLNENDLINSSNQAISSTFNFYSLNFKIIYFWHCYIKKIKYISYLEYYLLNKEKYAKNDFRDCKILLPFIFISIVNGLSKFLKYIIPIFDKYYVKYFIIIKEYFLEYSYKILSILSYIFSPFVFFFCLYKNTSEFLKIFNSFIKIFFKGFK